MSSPTVLSARDAHTISSLESPDYLIVGGGTSGCVIASRLARAGHYVILVEAGKDFRDNPLAFLPAGNQPLGKSDASWAYPANHVLSRHEKDGPKEGYLQGRMVGGSALLNYMQWYRGCKDDYDMIARKLDDKSWSWDAALARFKQMEDFNPAPAEGVDDLCNFDMKYHASTKGLLKTSFNVEWGPLSKEFSEACLELGH